MGNEDFECTRVIGKGSYGEVWLAKHKKDKKQYVLKKMNLGKASKKERKSAEQEAKLLSKLRHPNIVSYKDSFENEGYLYIAMQYCEGGDLYARLKEQKGVLLDERQVVEWFVQIAMALQYMHERNILHRDLKTQNIFLTKSKIIKVGDLGIARMLDSASAMATTLIGTPYYMSPELFSNKPYNHKSDVWALGCCVYEMTTLKHAFNAKDMNSLVYKILKGKMPPMPSQYSPELLILMRSMLHQDPEKRPSVNRILRDPYIKKNIALFLEDTKRNSRQINQSSNRQVAISNSRPSSASAHRRDSPSSLADMNGANPAVCISIPDQKPKVSDNISSKSSSVRKLSVPLNDVVAEKEAELDRLPASDSQEAILPHAVRKVHYPKKEIAPRKKNFLQNHIKSKNPEHGEVVQDNDIQESASHSEKLLPGPVSNSVQILPEPELHRNENTHHKNSLHEPVKNSNPGQIEAAIHLNDDVISLRKPSLDQAKSIVVEQSLKKLPVYQAQNDIVEQSSQKPSIYKVQNNEAEHGLKKPSLYSAQNNKIDHGFIKHSLNQLQSNDIEHGFKKLSLYEQHSNDVEHVKKVAVEHGKQNKISLQSASQAQKTENKVRPLPVPRVISSAGFPKHREDKVVSKNISRSSSVSSSTEDKETPRSLPNLSARQRRRQQKSGTSESTESQNSDMIKLRRVSVERTESDKITKSERHDLHPVRLKPARQPSINDSTSSSDDSQRITLKEGSKDASRENKEMNNFICLLDTTLKMNNMAESSEEDEEELVPSRKETGSCEALLAPTPSPLDSAKEHFHKSVSMPSVETLTDTSRLMQRIRMLHTDCIKGVGYTALKEAYAILNKIDEDEVEPKLVNLLGKEKFDEYAGKIWQLKFCEESLFEIP